MKQHPIPSSVVSMMMYCPFIDEEYKSVESDASMSNSQKRFVCYWWFAYNIYSVQGRGNRMVMPACIVHAVRSKFPEASGVYKGHRSGGGDIVAVESSEGLAFTKLFAASAA